MTPDRAANNRVLAGWIEKEPTKTTVPLPHNLNHSMNHAWLFNHWFCEWSPRDFYRDEAANAMLLEKMWSAGVQVRCHRTWSENGWQLCGWQVWYYEVINDKGVERLDEIVEDRDRKTAICNAALALIKEENR